MALSEKQKRFCDEYLKDCNATQAAIRAGYSEKTARSIGDENLTKPDIRAYLDSRMDQIRTKNTADAQEVIEYLTAVLRGDSLSEELVVEGTGDGCSEARAVNKAPSEKDRLKAAELLGKRYGLWKEKVDVGVKPIVLMGYEDVED